MFLLLLFSHHPLPHLHHPLPLTPLTGIRLNPCATPLGVGPSGRSQTQVMSPSSASMSVASTRRSQISFQQEYDATITVPEDVILPRHSGASSSSQQTAANRVTTLSKLGALGTSSWNQLADYESVDSRNGIRETCANMDSCFKSLRVCVKREERSRPKRCANIERPAKSPQNP